MKLYNVFIKQDSKGAIEDIRLLKDGISFLALIFTPLWFLYYRMWKEFFAVIIVTAIFSNLSGTFSGGEDILLEFILVFMIALNANYWLGEHLRKNKHYNFSGIVFGKNAAEAKLNFARNFGFKYEDFNLKTLLK
jgi:hypothetical protein